MAKDEESGYRALWMAGVTDGVYARAGGAMR